MRRRDGGDRLRRVWRPQLFSVPASNRDARGRYQHDYSVQRGTGTLVGGSIGPSGQPAEIICRWPPALVVAPPSLVICISAA